jgi:hypothetical protein
MSLSISLKNSSPLSNTSAWSPNPMQREQIQHQYSTIAQVEELWRGIWEVWLTHLRIDGPGEAAHHGIHLQERRKLIRSSVHHFIEQTGVSLLVWFQYIENYFGTAIRILYVLPFLRSKLMDTTGHTMGRSLSIHQPGEDVSFQSHVSTKSA